MDNSFIADYMKKDAWRYSLKNDISLATKNSKDIFAYVFYESIDADSKQNLIIPFLILGNGNSGTIQAKIAKSENIFKFPSEVLEMGDFFPAKIGISYERIALSRKSDCFNGRNLVFAGERKDDRFYHGFWGFDDSQN